MRKRKYVITIEEKKKNAERMWKEVLEDISNGVINQLAIHAAMDLLNAVDLEICRQNKRELLECKKTN